MNMTVPLFKHKSTLYNGLTLLFSFNHTNFDSLNKSVCFFSFHKTDNLRSDPCMYDVMSCGSTYYRTCPGGKDVGTCIHKCDASDARDLCGDHGTCFYDAGNSILSCRSVSFLHLDFL